MVLKHRFDVEWGVSEEPYHKEFGDECIDREIMFGVYDNDFTEVTDDSGLKTIDNINREINPIYVELARLKNKERDDMYAKGIDVQKKNIDMVIKDRKGRLTLLSILPF